MTLILDYIYKMVLLINCIEWESKAIQPDYRETAQYIQATIGEKLINNVH